MHMIKFPSVKTLHFRGFACFQQTDTCEKAGSTKPCHMSNFTKIQNSHPNQDLVSLSLFRSVLTSRHSVLLFESILAYINQSFQNLESTRQINANLSTFKSISSNLVYKSICLDSVTLNNRSILVHNPSNHIPASCAITKLSNVQLLADIDYQESHPQSHHIYLALFPWHHYQFSICSSQCSISSLESPYLDDIYNICNDKLSYRAIPQAILDASVQDIKLSGILWPNSDEIKNKIHFIHSTPLTEFDQMFSVGDNFQGSQTHIICSISAIISGNTLDLQTKSNSDFSIFKYDYLDHVLSRLNILEHKEHLIVNEMAIYNQIDCDHVQDNSLNRYFGQDLSSIGGLLAGLNNWKNLTTIETDEEQEIIQIDYVRWITNVSQRLENHVLDYPVSDVHGFHDHSKRTHFETHPSMANQNQLLSPVEVIKHEHQPPMENIYLDFNTLPRPLVNIEFPSPTSKEILLPTSVLILDMPKLFQAISSLQYEKNNQLIWKRELLHLNMQIPYLPQEDSQSEVIECIFKSAIIGRTPSCLCLLASPIPTHHLKTITDFLDYCHPLKDLEHLLNPTPIVQKLRSDFINQMGQWDFDPLIYSLHQGANSDCSKRMNEFFSIGPTSEKDFDQLRIMPFDLNESNECWIQLTRNDIGIIKPFQRYESYRSFPSIWTEYLMFFEQLLTEGEFANLQSNHNIEDTVQNVSTNIRDEPLNNRVNDCSPESPPFALTFDRPIEFPREEHSLHKMDYVDVVEDAIGMYIMTRAKSPQFEPQEQRPGQNSFTHNVLLDSLPPSQKLLVNQVISSKDNSIVASSCIKTLQNAAFFSYPIETILIATMLCNENQIYFLSSTDEQARSQCALFRSILKTCLETRIVLDDSLAQPAKSPDDPRHPTEEHLSASHHILLHFNHEHDHQRCHVFCSIEAFQRFSVTTSYQAFPARRIIITSSQILDMSPNICTALNGKLPLLFLIDNPQYFEELDRLLYLCHQWKIKQLVMLLSRSKPTVVHLSSQPLQLLTIFDSIQAHLGLDHNFNQSKEGGNCNIVNDSETQWATIDTDRCIGDEEGLRIDSTDSNQSVINNHQNETMNFNSYSPSYSPSTTSQLKLINKSLDLLRFDIINHGLFPARLNLLQGIEKYLAKNHSAFPIDSMTIKSIPNELYDMLSITDEISARYPESHPKTLATIQLLKQWLPSLQGCDKSMSQSGQQNKHHPFTTQSVNNIHANNSLPILLVLSGQKHAQWLAYHLQAVFNVQTSLLLSPSSIYLGASQFTKKHPIFVTTNEYFYQQLTFNLETREMFLSQFGYIIEWCDWGLSGLDTNTKFEHHVLISFYKPHQQDTDSILDDAVTNEQKLMTNNTKSQLVAKFLLEHLSCSHYGNDLVFQLDYQGKKLDINDDYCSFGDLSITGGPKMTSDFNETRSVCGNVKWVPPAVYPILCDMNQFNLFKPIQDPLSQLNLVLVPHYFTSGETILVGPKRCICYIQPSTWPSPHFHDPDRQDGAVPCQYLADSLVEHLNQMYPRLLVLIGHLENNHLELNNTSHVLEKIGQEQGQASKYFFKLVIRSKLFQFKSHRIYVKFVRSIKEILSLVLAFIYDNDNQDDMSSGSHYQENKDKRSITLIST